ncbi:MAG: Dabb family protein [Clostridia bacterium]|nr:Dabb family protein [Clostridia bacterium]
MVKHMIIWKLKSEVSDKEACSKEIKESLEGLVGKIEGLTQMHILTESFPASTGDIMMDSIFENAEALSNYQKHPLHVEIANTKVRPNVDTRLSFDYEV